MFIFSLILLCVFVFLNTKNVKTVVCLQILQTNRQLKESAFFDFATTSDCSGGRIRDMPQE